MEIKEAYGYLDGGSVELVTDEGTFTVLNRLQEEPKVIVGGIKSNGPTVDKTTFNRIKKSVKHEYDNRFSVDDTKNNFYNAAIFSALNTLEKLSN